MVFFFLVFGTMFLIGCICGRKCYTNMTILGIISVILFAISAILFTTAKEVKTYLYEVKVSDPVSINEFFEKYEIFEHRNKIFVIREIDKEIT